MFHSANYYEGVSAQQRYSAYKYIDYLCDPLFDGEINTYKRAIIKGQMVHSAKL